MKRYLYTGPMQSLELRVADADAGPRLVPVDCVPGQPVDLPEGHPVTIAMADAGFLVEPPAEIETPIAAEIVPPAGEADASLADEPAIPAPIRPRVRAGAETPKE